MYVAKGTRELFHKVYLYFSVISLNLLTFLIGIIFTWASPCLPKLRGTSDPENNPLPQPITPNEESWLVSVMFLGAMLGNIFSIILVTKLGRKKTILILTVPSVLGYLIFLLAGNMVWFYVGRILCGITLGMGFQLIPVYVGELSEVKNRGAMGSFFAIFIALGHQFTYSVGPFVSFFAFNLMSIFIPCVFIVIVLLLLEESPFDYVLKNDMMKAEKILRKLRYASNDDEIRAEMEELSALKKLAEERLKFGDLMNSKPLRWSLLICVGIAALQQLSAINAVVSYMQTIFDEAGGDIAPEISPIIVGVMQLIVCLIIPMVVDRFGRKMLLAVSEFMLGVSLLVLGTFFYLKINGHNIESITWLPLAALIVYMIFFNTGVGSITWIIMGEMFPSNAKDVAAAIATFALNLVAFAVTWLFPFLLREIDSDYTFWLVSIMCFLGFVFVLVVVPETKGKKFSEIQELLSR